MNILISAAGRRVSLVNAFKKIIKEKSLKSKVFTTDYNPRINSSASHFSDNSFEIGSFNDKDYIPLLLKLCKKNNVKVLIPTLDSELKILSENKGYFFENNIQIVVSDLNLIKITSDKILTNDFFRKLEIYTPKIFNKNETLKFPVFIKPVRGSNSKGIYIANEIGDVKPNDIMSDDKMIMSCINSDIYHEYTIDLYYDKNSELKCAVPRIRLKVVGGESNQGITKKNYVLEFVKKKFKTLNGAIGCITLQLFVDKETSKDIIGIEINPRFGGGYPFSLNAGANFPNFIIEEYLFDRKLDYSEDWFENCINLRYEKEIFFNNE